MKRCFASGIPNLKKTFIFIIQNRVESGRAETPSWFWSEEQADGTYNVRYCCEPASYKNPVDELYRIFDLGRDISGLGDNEQLSSLKNAMVRDYRKKKNNGDAETDAVDL